jgi:hypothetical protein
MRKLFILIMVFGVASWAAATPIFGVHGLDPSNQIPVGGTFSVTITGTAAEATGDGDGIPPGGACGAVGLDYSLYSNGFDNPYISFVDIMGGIVETAAGGRAVVSADTGFPGWCARKGAGDWSEATDVDSGLWFTWYLTADAVGTTQVELLDTSFEIITAQEIIVIDLELDFGDAPDSYSTLNVSNGARHKIVQGIMLGASIDIDSEGQPDPAAMGDDNDGNDDEDGVTFYPPIITGSIADVNVVASDACILNAWMDFNGDGDWSDAGEQIFTDTALAAGQNSLVFNVPQQAKAGYTFARFRVDSTGGLSYAGLAEDGEVEDYQVKIEHVLKWSQPAVFNEQSGCFEGWDEPSAYNTSEDLWFSCWANPRQCYGDADGLCEGNPSITQCVTLDDLVIFNASWGTSYPADYPPMGSGYEPCADFDRDGDVDNDDEDILKQWFHVVGNPADCVTTSGAQPPVRVPIVADDWACEDSRPVSDIHWWGSYRGWEEETPPQIVPVGFHIGIWTDVPAGADPCVPWSHPDEMIWEYVADMGQVSQEYVGCDFYPDMPFVPDSCFQYDLQLPINEWFWQEGPENIYWLSISAVYSDPCALPPYLWGWKTREHFYNDDAVRIFEPTPPVIGSVFLSGEPIKDPCGVSMDMAFELTTPHKCYPDTDPDYSLWLSVGEPVCWCYRYQCKGDTDNQFSGKDKDGNRQYVTLPDLTIFNAGWLKRDSDPAFSTFICADFDHEFCGKSKPGRRVFVCLPDLAIFNAGWLKPETVPHFTSPLCFP